MVSDFDIRRMFSEFGSAYAHEYGGVCALSQ